MEAESCLPAVPLNTLSSKSKFSFTSVGAVKQATPDIVVFDEETVDPEYITQAFFEEFGGTELIKISRSDLVDGKDVTYNVIANTASLRTRYNPNNIIAIIPYQDSPTNYGIDLFKRGVSEPYFDSAGNLIIEIEDVGKDEYIEVQIATGGTINRIQS